MPQSPLDYRIAENIPRRKRAWLGGASCVIAVAAGIYSVSNLKPPTSFYLDAIFWPAIAFMSLGGFGTGIALGAGGYFLERNRSWAIAGLILNCLGFLIAGSYVYGMYWYGHNHGWL